MHDSPKFRQRTTHLLRSLCGSWGVLPASYTLQGEVKVTDKIPWSHGGFGEVWCGTWGCEKVAVKVMAITGTADPKKLKKVRMLILTRNLGIKLTSVQQLSKEAIIWKQLKHRNLLPLYGVCASITLTGFEYRRPCLVSPWMKNGDVCAFVRNNPTFNRFNLASNLCLPCGILLTPSSWWTYARVSFTCIPKASSTGT